jgi:acyl transferase domain-containing protein
MGAEGRRVRADWLSDRPVVPLDEVTRAQPLLFAIDHALARLVMSWGVRPAAILGHSVGEVVGAVLAGVLDLADGVRLQMDRVGQMGAGPLGGMLAVAASADEMRPYLTDEVVIGVINGPRQVLLAGPEVPLAEVTERLTRDGFTNRRARALHGFHSPSLAGATERSLPAVAATRLRAPECTFFSAYTEKELTVETATSPRFWASQPSTSVHFGPALNAMLSQGDYLLVEAGPGQGLTALARRHAAVASGRSDAIGLLPARPGTARDDRRAMLEAAARLWTEGHALSWAPPVEGAPALV